MCKQIAISGASELVFLVSLCNQATEQPGPFVTPPVVLLTTVEPSLMDILYSGHLTIQDKMSQSRLNLHYTKYFTAFRNANASLFRKVDRFCSPASIWTVQNSLNNADAGRPLAQIVRHRWLIHQLDIILILVHIVLGFSYPFLPLYSKGELWSLPS